MKIYVGAGHSDTDPGAVAKGYTEADIAERFRNKVVAGLKLRGLEVVSDGEGTTNLPLKDAIRLAKTCTGPRVEIHLNAAANPKAAGVECLSKEKHKPLAQRLCKAVNKITGFPIRRDGGWLIDTGGNRPRLGFCEADGLILELCFISNPEELAKLLGEMDRLAAEIVNVLAKA